MSFEEEERKTRVAELVGEYLRLRELGDPAAAEKVLADCHGFVRRQVEENIALYEDLEDIGRLGRGEDPNPTGPTE